MRQTALHLVAPVDRTPDQLLAESVPELLEAEERVRQLRSLVDNQRIALARTRGVAFVRLEHVMQEFGG